MDHEAESEEKTFNAMIDYLKTGLKIANMNDWDMVRFSVDKKLVDEFLKILEKTIR